MEWVPSETDPYPIDPVAPGCKYVPVITITQHRCVFTGRTGIRLNRMDATARFNSPTGACRAEAMAAAAPQIPILYCSKHSTPNGAGVRVQDKDAGGLASSRTVPFIHHTVLVFASRRTPPAYTRTPHEKIPGAVRVV